MNGGTNGRVVGSAASITTILFWLLGYFAPALMHTAPTGLESAVTGLIIFLSGFWLPSDFLQSKGNDDGTPPKAP